MVLGKSAFKEKQSVYLILKQLSNNNGFDRIGFNFLIETVYKIASNYVYHNSKRIPLFSNNGLSNKDHAIDAISFLFVKDNNNSYPITNSFKNWNPEISSEEDALFFLYKIVLSRVEQHITKCLKESDPTFAKIFDSLNYFIKKHGYVKQTIFGQQFIKKDSSQGLEKKIISLEDLENVPSYYFMELNQVFETLFTYFENDSKFYLAIPLNALVSRIKNIQPYFEHTGNTSDFVESSMFVDEIVQRGYSIAYNKLYNSYYYKGKLSISETEIFEKTLQDLAKDLGNGGINSGLYNHLHKNMIDIGRNEYKLKFHNTLEYLLKIMRNNIKKELEVSNRLIA